MKRVKRILIVGDGARGKTTLAKNLGLLLGINVHSTDDFFWKTKFTEPRGLEKSIVMAKKVFKQKSWVVEGTTKRIVEQGLESADIIFYLGHKNLLTQYVVLFRRFLKRRKQKKESLKEFLVLAKHLFYKRYGLSYKKGVLKIIELIAPYEKKTVMLWSFKEIDRFLEKMKK